MEKIGFQLVVPALMVKTQEACCFKPSLVNFTQPVSLHLPGRKADTLKEPVFFHSGPYSLDEELVMGHAIQAINDLTPGYLVCIYVEPTSLCSK